MDILVNSTNTIWTTIFTTGSNSITLAGNNNFPFDIDSLDSAFNVTHNGAFNLAALQFTWYRANNLPIYTWIFQTLPASSSGGDTINLLLSIPQNQSDLVQLQKTGTGSAGSPGTFVGAENPSGTINGTNKVFTIANTPNGGICLLMTPSGGVITLQQQLTPTTSLEPCQYTLSGNTITYLVAPPVGATHVCNYYHN